MEMLQKEDCILPHSLRLPSGVGFSSSGQGGFMMGIANSTDEKRATIRTLKAALSDYTFPSNHTKFPGQSVVLDVCEPKLKSSCDQLVLKLLYKMGCRRMFAPK